MILKIKISSSYGTTRAYPNCEKSRALVKLKEKKRKRDQDGKLVYEMGKPVYEYSATFNDEDLQHLQTAGFEIEPEYAKS